MSTDSDRIYLDNNATTRPLPEVIETMARHFHDSYANPGSRHAEGRTARKALEESREQIAEILGAKPNEVIFTSGGTEATNMAIFGLTATHSTLSDSKSPGIILLTAGEHPATVESCNVLQKQGWKLQNLDVDSDGLFLADEYDSLPWDEIKLVTVIVAHNETGVIQDLQPISKLCQENSVPFHADAVQAVGKIPIHFHEMGATSLALGAHKFHGPRGIGALLLREDTELVPTQFGGHQEAGRRPGTEMVALATGMAKALEIWQKNQQERTEKLSQLRNQLQEGLAEKCEPVVINSSAEQRLPNTLNISFPGIDGDAILVALDLEGIACSLGSTCASGSAEPAPVLVAMGRSPEVYQSAVRFSLGIENSSDQIDQAVDRISTVIRRLQESMGSEN